MAKPLTPEQLVEDAFSLFAPDDSDWEQYKRRRSDLLSLIRSYAAQERKEERERCAAVAYGRAVEWDKLIAGDQTGMTKPRWLEACDIAALILSETPPPTQE